MIIKNMQPNRYFIYTLAHVSKTCNITLISTLVSYNPVIILIYCILQWFRQTKTLPTSVVTMVLHQMVCNLLYLSVLRHNTFNVLNTTPMKIAIVSIFELLLSSRLNPRQTNTRQTHSPDRA